MHDLSYLNTYIFPCSNFVYFIKVNYDACMTWCWKLFWMPYLFKIDKKRMLRKKLRATLASIYTGKYNLSYFSEK